MLDHSLTLENYAYRAGWLQANVEHCSALASDALKCADRPDAVREILKRITEHAAEVASKIAASDAAITARIRATAPAEEHA